MTLRHLCNELRLVCCGLCFSLLIRLAPKDNAEGMRIIDTVGNWAIMEIKLR